MTVRQVFMRAIGHTMDAAGEPGGAHHLPADIATAEADPTWHAAFTRRRAEGGSWPRPLDHCGWWWCREPDDGRVRWDELTEARELIRGHGHDPWSQQAANIAVQVHLMAGWAHEKDDYEKLSGALGRLDLEGDAKRLQQKFLDELRPFLENARNAKPDLGRRGAIIDTGRRAALAVGELSGWTPDEVAAIVLLVGVDKGSFASIKKSLRAIYARSQISLVED